MTSTGKLNPTIVENFILDGFAHTLRDVCEQFLANEQQERQIDKIIQRLRKAKKITLTRKGRAQLWTATPSQATQAA